MYSTLKCTSILVTFTYNEQGELGRNKNGKHVVCFDFRQKAASLKSYILGLKSAKYSLVLIFCNISVYVCVFVSGIL